MRCLISSGCSILLVAPVDAADTGRVDLMAWTPFSKHDNI